jgi:hypothetical protein
MGKLVGLKGYHKAEVTSLALICSVRKNTHSGMVFAEPKRGRCFHPKAIDYSFTAVMCVSLESHEVLAENMSHC